MKNLKKFEYFADNFFADEEADQMKNDEIFADQDAQDAQDAQAFGGEETEEEESLELEEVVNRVLATIEECGEDCDPEELKAKITEVLADFHNAQDSEEGLEDSEEGLEDLESEEGLEDLESEEDLEDESMDQVQFEGLRKFSDFK